MKKSIVFALLGVATASLQLQAAPVVEINSVQQQYPWTNTVDITYTSTGIISNNTYYVVFEAKDKDSNVLGLITNDLKISSGSTWTAQWQPPFNVRYENCTMTPYVYKGGQDDYMIVDLETWKVTYEGMSTQEASNAKYNTDEYKTKKLVLRKINAGTYLIGDNLTPIANSTNTQHSVTTPKDFYCAIFELTVSQYNRIMGNAITNESTITYDQINWNEIRGSAGVSAIPSTGVMGNLNSKNKDNLKGFDLPTYSMWEISARAGVTTPYFTGDSITDAILDYAWLSSNSSGTMQSVGTRLPNAWGIYDMQGNGWEWVRDISNITADLKDLQKDPLVPVTSGDSTKRCYMGYGAQCSHTDANAARYAKRWSDVAPNFTGTRWAVRTTYFPQ